MSRKYSHYNGCIMKSIGDNERSIIIMIKKLSLFTTCLLLVVLTMNTPIRAHSSFDIVGC